LESKQRFNKLKTIKVKLETCYQRINGVNESHHLQLKRFFNFQNLGHENCLVAKAKNETKGVLQLKLTPTNLDCYFLMIFQNRMMHLRNRRSSYWLLIKRQKSAIYVKINK